jgi:hypothetical protein
MNEMADERRKIEDEDQDVSQNRLLRPLGSQ